MILYRVCHIVGRLERIGKEGAGSRAKSGRAQQEIVELVESGKALKLLNRSKSAGRSYSLCEQTPDSMTIL